MKKNNDFEKINRNILMVVLIVIIMLLGIIVIKLMPFKSSIIFIGEFEYQDQFNNTYHFCDIKIYYGIRGDSSLKEPQPCPQDIYKFNPPINFLEGAKK